MIDTRKTSEIVFEALTAEDDGRMCKDISDSACHDQPGNFLRHVIALAMSKVADGLLDPKLVLAWLLTTLGAPAAMTGLLVPIREAGALLPQLFTAAHIRALPRRKWVWAGAGAVQGLAALVMAAAAFLLDGAAAGATILTALALLAIARSAASVAYKDVLGKTVARTRRGTATGLASSIAAGGVIVFALVLLLGGEIRMTIILAALSLSGLFWLISGAVFASLKEEAGASSGGANGIGAALSNLRYLRDDRQLTRFILARGLLTATALAPPYMVILAAGEAGAALAGLGALVLASSLAALLSGYIWGRLADRSSRRVLMLTGAAGAASLVLALLLNAAGLSGTVWTLPLALFGLMISHQGVRVGRATYLVDMVDQDRRAIYTALANTVIGMVLLAGGAFGAIASAYGAEATLTLFALMALAGSWVAYGLKELGES